MLGEAILSSAVGAMLWLDRFQVLQIMVSRPLVCASIVGWVAGDFRAGLACGIMYELLWLRRPPVGGYIPPDVTFGAIVTAAVSAFIRQQVEISALAASLLAFFFLLPSCLVGVKIDSFLRRLLRGLAEKTEVDQRRLRDGMVTARLLMGASLGFLLAFTSLFPLILVGSAALGYLATWLTPGLKTALGTAYYAVPLLGVADTMVGLEERRNLVLFLLGFVVVAGGGYILG